MSEQPLLERITFNPEIYGGKAIVRGHRLAVEHVLDMLAAGATEADVLRQFDWLENDDFRACLLYAARMVGNEVTEPLLTGTQP